MNIGQRIKSLRESNGLTQEELGKAIGVNKATVNRYETGVIDIKRTVAIKLAEALDTTPAYLMGWDEDTKEMTLRDLFENDPEWKERLEKFKNNPEYKKNLPIIVKTLQEVSSRYEEMPEDFVRLINYFQQLSNSGKEKVIDYAELIHNSEKDK